MAFYTAQTVKFLSKKDTTLLGNPEWNELHQIGSIVPVSGIYRCEGCGDEITSNKGDPFPPQNKHQHPSVFGQKVEWRLIVQTQTQG